MTEQGRELHERWALVMLGYRQMRPGHLINPDIPEQTVANLRSELVPPEADPRRLALVLHEIVARAVKKDE